MSAIRLANGGNTNEICYSLTPIRPSGSRRVRNDEETHGGVVIADDGFCVGSPTPKTQPGETPWPSPKSTASRSSRRG
jgi:hypothetical protein